MFYCCRRHQIVIKELCSSDILSGCYDTRDGVHERATVRYTDSTLHTLFNNVKAVSRRKNKHKNRHYKYAAHAKKMQKYMRNIRHHSSLKFSTEDVLIYSGR